MLLDLHDGGALPDNGLIQLVVSRILGFYDHSGDGTLQILGIETSREAANIVCGKDFFWVY